jgi:hypothetical protein
MTSKQLTIPITDIKLLRLRCQHPNCKGAIELPATADAVKKAYDAERMAPHTNPKCKICGDDWKNNDRFLLHTLAEFLKYLDGSKASKSSNGSMVTIELVLPVEAIEKTK